MEAPRTAPQTTAGHDDAGVRNPWSGVDMRHLAALAAVAHEGSFRGAADALGYGQSAISQQVAHLEQMVGHRLFERRRGATPALTAAGELLVAHADEILVRLEAARSDLDGTRAQALDHLRIGTLESTSTMVMPQALLAMRRCAPAVQVQVTEADHGDDLLELIRNERLDLAFVHGAKLERSFASVRLMSDPIVLAVAARSELGSRPDQPTAADLRSLDLIHHRMMPDLEPTLRDVGIEARYTLSCERIAAIHALVAAGVAAAILPALAVDADDPRLAVRPLDQLFEPAVLRLAWLRHGQLPAAGRLFADQAQRIALSMRPEFGARPALAAA